MMEKLSRDATEEQKSLALAELMGWNLEPNPYSNGTYADEDMQWNLGVLGKTHSDGLYPYEHHVFGLAQFAAILLELKTPFFVRTWSAGLEPTQTNILDEILRMEGKME